MAGERALSIFALGAVQAGGQASWEPGLPAWLSALEPYAPWALAAVWVLLIARALRNHRRYRALAVLDAAAQQAVRAAIATAEKRTVGEVVPVVVERSDDHPSALWLAALCSLLLGSALLEGLLPWHQPAALLLCQLGLGAVGFLAAMALPDLKRLLVLETRATQMAEEQAQQEFYRLGLHKTRGATGVLIFVSLFERRVIVLADEGVASKVDREHWLEIDDVILTAIRKGSLRDGLITAIERCGDTLARHCPWVEGDRNEIPDRLIVRRR